MMTGRHGSKDNCFLGLPTTGPRGKRVSREGAGAEESQLLYFK